ncbi:hypothetical protein SLS62_004955 [Diatrype stigma]|uniref:Uncharacterized protein n=1 Tax=Diatrype stigma TaxID=117547 RepID=A0AAN9YQ10_9PEZI
MARPASSSKKSKSSHISSKPAPRLSIPPESPLFINVPNPPQDQSIEARRELKPVKGHLPLPRTVFRKRDAHIKSTAAFVAQTAPAPTSAGSQRPAGSDIQAWKRRMAAGRRENLGAGLRDLWQRKQQLDARRAADRRAKLAANRAAALAPERDDDVLTRGTVNAKTLATTVMPDPFAVERSLAARERTAALAAERAERRRDALQELYISARLGPFVIDEAGLSAAVEREFSVESRKFHGRGALGQDVVNIWDLEGSPSTVADMLREVSGRNNHVVQDHSSQKHKTEKRQKQVAEELTGGKLDRLMDEKTDH